jgi:hypothetical protein
LHPPRERADQSGRALYSDGPLVHGLLHALLPHYQAVERRRGRCDVHVLGETEMLWTEQVALATSSDPPVVSSRSALRTRWYRRPLH